MVSASWTVLTPGGSLVEAPEIIKVGAYYYLFFAAGMFCQASYAEGGLYARFGCISLLGVARSTSLFGPYEKLLVPFLSTGIVGNGAGKID